MGINKFRVTPKDGKINENERYMVVNIDEPYAGLVADMIENNERLKGTWEHGDRTMREVMGGINGPNKLPRLSIPEMVKRAHVMHRIIKGFELVHFTTDIALIHSEVSEALKAHRNEEGIDRIAEELADIILRTAVVCGDLGIDLEDAILRKIAENSQRPYKYGGKPY